MVRRLVEAGAEVQYVRPVRHSLEEVYMTLMREEAPIMPLTCARRHLLVKLWVTNYRVSPIGQWFWKDIIIEPH